MHINRKEIELAQFKINQEQEKIQGRDATDRHGELRWKER